MIGFKAAARLGTGLTFLAALSGCGGMATRTTETVTSYAIYDVAPGTGNSAGKISESIKQALKGSMSSVNIVTGIPPSPLPDKAGRFQLNNPFKGSPMAALMAPTVVPSCEGSLLTAYSTDSGMASYGENTLFFVCLLPYTAGYHVDIYVSFTRKSGLFNSRTMAATLMRPLTGDSSQFIPRTIQKIVQSIEGTGATVALVEQYP